MRIMKVIDLENSPSIPSSVKALYYCKNRNNSALLLTYKLISNCQFTPAWNVKLYSPFVKKKYLYDCKTHLNVSYSIFFKYKYEKMMNSMKTK